MFADKAKRIAIMIIGMVLLPLSVYAADNLKASLAKMPVYAESKNKGVLVDLTKAMAKELGIEIPIRVDPFARSMKNVIDRKVDFHMPLIKSPGYYKKELPYDHSTATIFHVNFVLYTNVNKPLTMDQLKTSKIETDAAHTEYFPFKTVPTNCIECSLKKVSISRIDGFIFADFATDGFLKTGKIANIKRQLYKVFDVKIILPKGERGGPIDQALSKAIEGLSAKGEFQKIMSPIDLPYNDWQP